MEWAEIKRRLKNGTSVQVLADLEGIPYKTMYNRIMAHQVKDGVTYLTPENTKGMKKAKAISDTKQKQAKEKEKAAGLPEDPEKLPEEKKKVPDPGPAASINGVNLCDNCKMCQKDPEPFCKKFRNQPHGIVDYCTGYVSGVPEDVPKLPEDIDSETIAAVLKDINRAHADAVKTLHEHEEMLEQARKSERQLRTLLIAMEQLAKGRKLPEGQ